LDALAGAAGFVWVGVVVDAGAAALCATAARGIADKAAIVSERRRVERFKETFMDAFPKLLDQVFAAERRTSIEADFPHELD
jgi:hypothetical protein